MNIVSNFPDYFPVLVWSEKFEDLWRSSDLHVPEWVGGPRDQWFKHNKNGEKVAFIAAEVLFDEDGVISFINGRHRTRWLLNRKKVTIPICIPIDTRDEWNNRGILAKAEGNINLDFG